MAQTAQRQRLKDLNERLGIEQLKLSKVSENANALHHLKAGMLGKCSVLVVMALRHKKCHC